MKSLIIIIALAATTLTVGACNNTSKSTASGSMDTPQLAAANTNPAIEAKPSTAVKGLLDSYLQLKNALAADNSDKAATAEKQ